MKTKLIFLFLLIVSFSCGTNNKPVSDAQKEKIKEEVKEVVSTFLKACEEVNQDMIIETWLDSPDFIIQSNGHFYNYKECTDGLKSTFSTLLNQKGTIIDESFAVLDNSTVMYTANSKWVMNFKDGHSVLQDPWAIQYLFKKIDNRWKIVTGYESGVEKNVYSDNFKELNQVELMKQFIGNWKCEIGKDTIEYSDIKSYGTGLEGNFKHVTKNKIFFEGKQLYGYDKKTDKFILSVLIKGMDIQMGEMWFTSKNICVVFPYSDISNLVKAPYKVELEFKSPDIMLYKTIVNNNIIKTDTFSRVNK